jgi:hypothetical protein
MLQVPAAETAAQALAVLVHHGEGACALKQPGGFYSDLSLSVFSWRGRAGLYSVL